MQWIKAFLFAGTTALAVVSAQSASAGDQALPSFYKAPPPPPSAWTWDGLYASVSAGGTLTHGNMGESSNDPSVSMSQSFFNGALTNANVQTGTNTSSGNVSGNGASAVFTFSGGYNVVLWNNWLFGVQPDASWNLSKTRLTGTSTSVSTSTSINTFLLPPSTPSTNTSSSTGPDGHTLQNDWTISALARIGYLVNQDWLVYGLVGWSWGGFDLDNGSEAFVMNGFTYGGGVEKNFGWLRAFIQVKAIDYSHANISTSDAFTSSSTNVSTPFFNTFSNTTSGSTNRSISANVVALTGGVTIPLWHP